MKKALIVLLLCGFIPSSLMAKKLSNEEICQNIREQLELTQFKYHDTLAQMMVELKESSTPGLPLNMKRINNDIKSLKNQKKKMVVIINSKSYEKCFN